MKLRFIARMINYIQIRRMTCPICKGKTLRRMTKAKFNVLTKDVTCPCRFGEDDLAKEIVVCINPKCTIILGQPLY